MHKSPRRLGGDLLLRSAQPLTARQQREHQRPDPPYLPKGTDLSVYSQEQLLDAIAYELNIRPCKRFDFKCPIEVMTEVMAKQHDAPASIQ